MDIFVNKLIDFSGKDSNKEVVLYGLQTLADGIISLIILLSMGFLLHKMFYTLLYIFFSYFMTCSTGGYHASTRLGCGTVTICMYLIAVFGPEWIVPYLSLPSFFMVGITSVAIVWILAPVVHPDKPLTPQCFQKNKLSARIWIVLFIITGLVLFHRLPTVAAALWINQLELAVSVLIGWWANNHQKTKGETYHEEENCRLHDQDC